MPTLRDIKNHLDSIPDEDLDALCYGFIGLSSEIESKGLPKIIWSQSEPGAELPGEYGYEES